jgi:CubicO group peptidase (beta-lactamase class C family)
MVDQATDNSGRLRSTAVRSLERIQEWPVTTAAAAVVAADGSVLGSHGEQNRVFRLASVTKLLTAYATLIAVEEGAIELDEAAGPEGATVRHLMAHTSGLAFNEHKTVAPPGERRLYSNAGFEELASTVEQRSGIGFADYVGEALLTPLGMAATTMDGSPAAGASSSVADLTRLAAELQRPTLLHPATLAEATRVIFPGVNGVLPGLGHQKPNDWGLGFELRDHKKPHWTGSRNSERTFGHFGQSGTFLWVDPDAGVACVCLTDRDFGQWAIDAWPAFSDEVLAEVA